MIRNLIPITVLTVILILSGCTTEQPEPDITPDTAAVTESRTYESTGVVLEVTPQQREVRLDHAEIPGFMDAMAMTYTVEDASLLEGLAQGDSVRFEVTERGAEFLVTDIEPIDQP